MQVINASPNRSKHICYDNFTFERPNDPFEYISVKCPTHAIRTHPEVFLCDGERVEHLGVNLIVLQVDQVHLLTDLLQCGFRAQGRQIGTYVTVCLCGNLL